jgi:hypothetical protein
VSEAKLLKLVAKLGHDVKIAVGPVRRRRGKALQCDPIMDTSTEDRRPGLLLRLDAVRHLGYNLGYGVGAEMGELLVEHGFDGRK